MMRLLHMIESHLRQTGISPSRFGRQVMGDPRFVHDLRNGRQPRIGTEQRVAAYFALHNGSPRI